MPSDLPPAGHREFIRKRRWFAKVVQHLQAAGLPGQEQAQTFPVHLYRRNCRPNTLRAHAGAIQLFLTFPHYNGKAHLEALTREDLEAFLEQEQDRGLKITTVSSRLGLVKAWRRFLIDREVVRPAPDVPTIDKIKVMEVDYARLANKLKSIQPLLREWAGL